MYYGSARKGEDRESVTESIFREVIVENFSNLKEVTDIQISEVSKILNRINSKRPISRHIKIS